MIRKIMHRPQAVLGLAMMLLVFLVMLLAPVFAPNDPMQLNVAHSFAPPDAQYPLGTDELGRCILSRLIYGARASLSIALPTLLLLAVISTVVATLCAYVGGALDRVFEVVSNIFMAFPPFLVAITLVGLFESKAASIVLSIVIAMWVWNARVVRTHVLRERNQPYVITCRMSGCSELRIVFRHIIPNILPHLLVLYSTGLSSIIIMISSYAFLGLGLETGTAEWGAMFVNANKLMFSHPQFLVYPGLCILFAAAGFNLFGEALRDICAPREGYQDSEVWYADHHRYHRRHLFLSDRLRLDRPARLGARWHSKRCRAQNRRLSEIQGHCSELCLLLPRYHGLPRQSLVCRRSVLGKHPHLHG